MPLARRTERLLNELQLRRYKESLEIREWLLQRARYVEEGEYQFDQTRETVSPGRLQSEVRETLFLETTVTVPAGWAEETVGIVFKAGGEGLLSIHGKPYHGLDKNRSFVPLSGTLAASGELKLNIELYHVPPIPADPLNGQKDNDAAPVRFEEARLVTVSRAAEGLYFTVTVCFDAMKRMAERSTERLALERALEEAILNIGATAAADEECLVQAERQLRKRLQAAAGNREPETAGIMHMVGQSHIDLAWLWPLKETVRKTGRTFSTVITLMEHYGEYRYSQSQPQLYAYAKQHFPDLYEQIKKRIADGRWELVGGMWIEPDLNIPSGESLVRQLLYGRAFYEQEFGKSPRVEWLPDTFGYCASLPQLLRKSGVDYFMTSKMNWNDTNVFPHDLFYWEGIDGTKILSFLNHGLNENTLPADVGEHWDSFRQKKAHSGQMLLYGYGDGGGGVTREMLEVIERSAALPGLPSSRFSTAHEFFDGVRDAAPGLPVWSGDMYLELHRGTYTTHGKNKRWNRKAEALYREAEIWNALSYLSGAAQLEACAELQHGELKEGWELLLLNQFHDIIPGTSIPEVYVKSEEHYREIFDLGELSRTKAVDTLAAAMDTRGQGTPLILFNSLSWSRKDTAVLTGNAELLNKRPYDGGGNPLPFDLLQTGDKVELVISAGEVPALGYTTVWLRDIDGAEKNPPAVILPLAESVPGHSQGKTLDHWETEYYRLVFDAGGRIVSWFDKEAGRELVAPGAAANHLQLFHDRPTVWDAWDIDPHFAGQPAGEAALLTSEVLHQGQTRDILRFSWQLNDSLIEQHIIFHRHSRRVDFETRVDWREEHKLLKAAFPVDIRSTKAVYEIPFGSVERPTHNNTSWEQAQFEVCGHRWADLSEGGYGISLLNDCKYGYDIKGNVMRLSLLRSPRWPDTTADIGVHEFTYSLYPHAGGWREAEVVKEGQLLNQPIHAAWASAHGGILPAAASLLNVTGQHTVVDAIKISEDASGAIIRLYESGGGRGQAELSLSSQFSIMETDLMEKEAGEPQPAVNTGTLSRAVTPYEVVTLKVTAGRQHL
ncbi:alpha-mannosidase [Paenibacillus sp. FSL R7-0273]|uniref:alpha-mannosidase n=1 Tax=Paenibacillus sp. FSL R7-0273 TaxID=1536772 RepID=UPI000A6747D4|nr:alpha-mannosidase [Paenibacillus sp. FSL R7-0273]